MQDADPESDEFEPQIIACLRTVVDEIHAFADRPEGPRSRPERGQDTGGQCGDGVSFIDSLDLLVDDLKGRSRQEIPHAFAQLLHRM